MRSIVAWLWAKFPPPPKRRLRGRRLTEWAKLYGLVRKRHHLIFRESDKDLRARMGEYLKSTGYVSGPITRYPK